MSSMNSRIIIVKLKTGKPELNNDRGQVRGDLCGTSYLGRIA
jgi:hypothetical protein